MSWNRTYRPTQVADLQLDFVRTQLQSMLSFGKIPQALLFAGPKGTGKTSTSRIIGALVNDPKNAAAVEKVYFLKQKPSTPLLEPDAKSSFNQKVFAGTSFVVQEMDAASNRGIDDIRQLKSRVSLPPQEGKMSVFILDEAHMLTTEAFNALLKLLEEPPEHAIFILATTELHKIPETIVSRCQLVEFTKASIQEITRSLEIILKQEKISCTPEALTLIAQTAQGSFRDAVKLLELASQSGSITLDQVAVFTNTTTQSDVAALLKHLLNKDEKAVVQLFESLRNRSVDQRFFHTTLLESIHTSLLQNLSLEKGESLLTKAVAQFLLQELSDSVLSSASPIAHLKLELKILELIDRSKNKAGNSGGVIKKNPQAPQSTRIASAALTSAPTQFTPAQFTPTQSHEAEFQELVNSTDSVVATSHATTHTAGHTAANPFTATEYSQAGLLQDKWHDFIEQLAVTNSTLAILLRSAKLVATQDTVATIGVYYNFHKEQLLQKKSIGAIQTALEHVIGGSIELEFILIQPPNKAELIEPATTDSLVNSALQALL